MPTIEKVVPLLVQAFGFEPGGVERAEDGTAIHAEVRAGQSTIWLHRVDPKHDLVSARSSRTATCGLYVQVDDVDAHFIRAQAKGAQVESPPQDRPYGAREYASRDIEGHRWWFGSPLEAT